MMTMLKNTKWLKRRWSVRILLLLALSAAFPAFLSSQVSEFALFDGESNARADHFLEKYGEVYLRINPSEKAAEQKLHKYTSFTGYAGDGEIFAFVNRNGYQRLLEENIDFIVCGHPSEEVNPVMKSKVDINSPNDWDFYPTYEAYTDIMQQFQSEYPDICKVFSIGLSTEGRSILFAKISDNVNMAEKKPLFLYTSSMHGNELTGYVLMLHLIDHLLKNYGTDSKVTWLVNNLEIWINPLANPDGTYAGGNNTVGGATRFNANNIDLNRNYPDPKSGPHPDGNEWQQETIEFMALADSVSFSMAANIHGGAEVCNYPWDTWQKRHADDDWWQYVCRRYADTVHLYGPPGYLDDLDNGITNGYDWYSIDGGRQDYMNYFWHCREITLEISNIFIPSASLLPAYWEYNYRSLLNYMNDVWPGVQGTITDSVSGNPVRAMISINGHDIDSSQVFSRKSSGFYCRPLLPGTYSMSFSAPGYKTKTVPGVQVTGGQAHILDVDLVQGSNGIIDSSRTGVFIVGPNPAGDHLRIKYAGDIPATFDIVLYDRMGRHVLGRPTEYFTKGTEKTIATGQLPGGIYLLTLFSRDERISLKIIIEH